jgi:hypothetical protein
MNNFKDLGYYERVNDIIESLELKNKTDNDIIKNRFLYEVLLYEQKRDNTKKYYNIFRFIVTVGSIFLPAILSIGQMDPAKLPRNFDAISYWASWSISLTVTACNGFLQLFSLDKNYFTYSIVTEQLKTEGWQYLQLSGKYEDSPSHEAAFKVFCKSIENIKRKQIEQEFSGGKAGDKKKTFDFQKQLKNTLPEQHQTSTPGQGQGQGLGQGLSGQNISQKLELFDTMMKTMKPNISETQVTEAINNKAKEVSSEVTNEMVDNAIDKIDINKITP